MGTEPGTTALLVTGLPLPCLFLPVCTSGLLGGRTVLLTSWRLGSQCCRAGAFAGSLSSLCSEQTKAQRSREVFDCVSCLPVAESGLVPPVLLDSTAWVTKHFGGCVMPS